jgi:hypothetical protein
MAEKEVERLEDDAVLGVLKGEEVEDCWGHLVRR